MNNIPQHITKIRGENIIVSLITYEEMMVINIKDQKDEEFENYQEFLDRTGRENNTESLRYFMNKNGLP